MSSLPGQPLVLLANPHEWSSRSVESVLNADYAVVRTYTVRETLEQVRRRQPDVLMLDTSLPDLDVFSLCRVLRHDPHVTPSTPILITTSGPSTRQLRLEALRAGANEVWAQPVDAEEVGLRLEALVRAKLDADQARAEGLVDRSTGLYNRQGLLQRARDLGGQAARRNGALACVAFETAWSEPEPVEGFASSEPQSAVTLLARTLSSAGRQSDAIGRLGPLEFAILAPDCDQVGAAKLAARMVRALEDAAAVGSTATLQLKVRSGYAAAAADAQAATRDPATLLVDAKLALQATPAEAGTP